MGWSFPVFKNFQAAVVRHCSGNEFIFCGVCHASDKTTFYYPINTRILCQDKCSIFQQDTIYRKICHKNKIRKLQIMGTVDLISMLILPHLRCDNFTIFPTWSLYCASLIWILHFESYHISWTSCQRQQRRQSGTPAPSSETCRHMTWLTRHLFLKHLGEPHGRVPNGDLTVEALPQEFRYLFRLLVTVGSHILTLLCRKGPVRTFRHRGLPGSLISGQK